MTIGFLCRFIFSFIATSFRQVRPSQTVPFKEGRARSNKKSVQIVISLLRFRGTSDKLIL